MNTSKTIGNMYTTETFRSRPAFTRFVKTSFSSQKLWIKKIKSCNMVLTDRHSLAEKYTCDFSSITYKFSEDECLLL